MISERNFRTKSQQATKHHEKLLSHQRDKHTNCNVNLEFIVGDRKFRDELSLHWSAIHYEMTFVCHSGRGSETPFTS